MRALLSRFAAPPTQSPPAHREQGELVNLHLLAYLVANNAIVRQESRGAHQRTEFTATDDVRFRRRYWVSLNESGWTEVQLTLPAAPSAVAANF
jgi:succinate dehydrogenase/fumarate reductase flavoprotein subunit